MLLSHISKMDGAGRGCIARGLRWATVGNAVAVGTAGELLCMWDAARHACSSWCGSFCTPKLWLKGWDRSWLPAESCKLVLTSGCSLSGILQLSQRGSSQVKMIVYCRPSGSRLFTYCCKVCDHLMEIPPARDKCRRIVMEPS